MKTCFLLLVGVLLISAIAQSQDVSSKCQKCTTDYATKLEDVGTSSTKLCTAMTAYFKCLDKEDCPSTDAIKKIRKAADKAACGHLPSPSKPLSFWPPWPSSSSSTSSRLPVAWPWRPR